MGGGRRKKGDEIDHAVGLKIHQRIGDPVNRGDPLLTLYCEKHGISEYLGPLRSAIKVTESQVPPRPLVLHRQIASV